ncbi:MAG TPA: DUF1844 domain-containing protein, partial [Candidatus Binataceae bacterium]|nr:DUF1844 domain-containing protein [Candidatus Binataceae bacterium]
RRRFSAEGEAKPDLEPAQTAADSQTGAAAQAADSAPQPQASIHADNAEPEIDFVTFLVGLSTQALAALGEMPDPVTGKAERDLRAAQHLIDIVAMLREKTRGNLEANEQSLIEAILFDLRMKYVELARSPAR